jgi:hypothetical protein
MLIVGIVLVLLGGFILVRGATYTSKRDVLKIGPIETSLEEKKSVPPWVGGIAVAAGVGLIVAGARRRR